jgi:tetratricopeptide (TPR) repeat protein
MPKSFGGNGKTSGKQLRGSLRSNSFSRRGRKITNFCCASPVSITGSGKTWKGKTRGMPSPTTTRGGKKASKIAPEKPGGYFFEAANLARKNNLKGTFSNLWGISKVRKLNEKTASIDPGYFYRGTDRFFCAYYTKLPKLLKGNVSKAIEFGKRAVEAFPNYAGNRFFLAEAYVKDGRNDLARKELEAAISLPDDAFPDVIPEQRMEKKRAEALLKRIAK